MVSFVGTICGSPVMGVTSLLVAMCAGTIGRVCFGLLADHIGPLASYAIASVVQTLCVLLFPTLNDSQSLLTLSAVFGAGFAGNMTCLSLCVRQAVPAQRFGGSLGAVMLMAWSGMAAGGYTGGYLYDLTLGYGVAFILAGVAGCLNLLVLAIVGLRMRQQVVATSRQRGIPIQ
jgi:predicted MFS family arabinose efflux permease